MVYYYDDITHLYADTLAALTPKHNAHRAEVIDFTVTLKGLEQQLLGKLIGMAGRLSSFSTFRLGQKTRTKGGTDLFRWTTTAPGPTGVIMNTEKLS